MSARREEPPIDEDLAAHARRNASLVRHITDRGGDPQRPRSIDCFFHVRSEDDAIALSAALQPRGFRDIEVTHAAPSGGHPWTVQASVRSTVAAFTAPARVEELVRIAAHFDAEFDGWGTQLDEVPPTI